MQRENRFERMRPGELEALMEERPLAWIPVGTLEWHGRHLPVGLDAIKAHELCIRAARIAGGAVLPADFFSRDGMLFPWTFRYPPDILARSVFRTLWKLEDYGFRAMFIVTGHYPVSQVATLIGVAHTFMAVRRSAVVAMPEFFAARDDYHGDHAAKWETSIMMELFPDLVEYGELDSLDGDRPWGLFRKGVQGVNPGSEASRDTGREVVNEMVQNMAGHAAALLGKNGRREAAWIHARGAAGFLRGKATEGMKAIGLY